MAQAGIHGIVAMAVRKWTPGRKWLMLGIVLGNILPDADNIAVAIATLTGKSTEGLHRTFTHSLFFVAALIILGYIIAAITKRSTWKNLGVGLGIGVFDAHPARPVDLVQWSRNPVADSLLDQLLGWCHPSGVVEQVDDADRVSLFRSAISLIRKASSQTEHGYGLLT